MFTKKLKGTWAIGPIKTPGDLPLGGIQSALWDPVSEEKELRCRLCSLPRKSGGDGTGSDNSRWITEEQRGRDIQREDSDQEGRGGPFIPRQAGLSQRDPLKITALGEGEGRKGIEEEGSKLLDSEGEEEEIKKRKDLEATFSQPYGVSDKEQALLLMKISC